MALLCPFVGIICLWDYARRRIPNPLILFLFGSGILQGYAAQGIKGVGDYLLCCVIVFGILFPAFSLGAMGGGDVKLFAVAAGFFPAESRAGFLLVSFGSAAVLAVLKLAKEKETRRRIAHLKGYVLECLAEGAVLPFPEELEIHGHSAVVMSGPALLGILLHLAGLY